MKLFKPFCTVLIILVVVSCNKKETKIAVFQPNDQNGKDTAISESNPSANYSTLDRIHMVSLSSNDSVKNDVRSLLRFGFATLKEEISIDSAFVHLYAIDPGHFGSNNSFVLIPVKKVWINDEVTWNNQPEVDTNKTITVEAPTNANQDYKINITDYVRAVHQNKQPNYGFMIQLEDEKNAYKGLRFHSSNSKDVSKHPKLEVFYTE
ncbi:DNRLRE domain-containing protein [Olleya sp. YS]|uniref:DNRLRE domain-containing protein n=1 Tax=Olleya sp. YS TaxID=3028318 RepID=UPI0024342E31|nr:DNRLRE domain-containing protein [Olleya sp. YS]WGD35774.1 DNRLRE domain-containing protein [Olleya sp. YS]